MADTQPPAGGNDRVRVVALPAEIDAVNADGVGEVLQAACAPEVTTVVADMTATTFCDSGGIRALVLAHRQASACGTELRVVVPCAGVLRVLAVTGVDGWLPIYPSVQEALATPLTPPVRCEGNRE